MMSSRKLERIARKCKSWREAPTFQEKDQRTGSIDNLIHSSTGWGKPLKGRGPRWKICLPPADKPLNWPEGALGGLSTMCVPSTTRWKASRVDGSPLHLQMCQPYPYLGSSTRDIMYHVRKQQKSRFFFIFFVNWGHGLLRQVISSLFC